MQDGATVIGTDGLLGVISTPDKEGPGGHACLRLNDGRTVFIQQTALIQQQDGSYRLPMSASEFGQGPALDETVIPVIAEELVVHKRQIPTGGVRVHKTVHEHDEVIAMPLMKEHVDIRRVVIGRDVDGPLPIRREGDTIIVPVVEEVIVVEKRMRLKEELHITKRASEEQTEQTVTLQREEAIVERLDAEGRGTPEEPLSQEPVSQNSGAAQIPARNARPLRRNRIIRED